MRVRAAFPIRPDRRGFRTRTLGIAARAAAWLFGGAPVAASAAYPQDVPAPPPPPIVQFKVELRTQADRQEADRLAPPRDRDTEGWLKRAAEAATREDWKLAADTIARVIEQDGHKTISPDDKHYYSAGWYANRMIATWPSEGQSAYRVLYDGTADGLFERARREHDLEALRTVAYKYPMTTVGPAAIDLLTGWLIDQGRCQEALELLGRLPELPHSRIPQWRILQKRAIAFMVSGERGEASKALQALRDWGGKPGAADLPRDWESRIEALLRFHEDRKLAGAQSGELENGGPWSIPLGPPSRTGRMAMLNPSVLPEAPWRDAMPGTEELDVDELSKVIRGKGRVPVWQAVTDGQRLFASTPAGIMCRDLATFDFQWQTFASSEYREIAGDSTAQVIILRNGRFEPAESEPSDRLSQLSTRTLYHEYAGAVSTAGGLVFALEQNTFVKDFYPTKSGDIPPTYTNIDIVPNSLRTFEAATGRAVWTRGSAGPAADDLKDARFLCVPVPCGDHVIVTYLQRDELKMDVLRPDGNRVKTIFLGSGRPHLFPMDGVLQPTVVDETIYVPTGAGMLIALSAADYSLRWLASYERVDQSPTGRSRRRGRGNMWNIGVAGPVMAPDEWLSTPPLVVGGLVLAAPQDAESLLAFSQRDGVQRWAYARGDYRYVIGADEQHVYLGGRRIAAVRLSDGREAWTYPSGGRSEGGRMQQAAGRAALVGERILVPMKSDLVVLSAQDGSLLDATPVEEGLLGNLLVADGSLYSVGATTIAKFPDIEQTMAAAEARLASQPGDAEALTRLAWLSVLRKDWRRVLELLDQVRTSRAPGPGEIDDARRPPDAAPTSRDDSIAHLRVKALLSLAAEAPDADRSALLDRAAAEAQRPDDVVRAGLALFDHLARGRAWTRAFGSAVALLTREEVADRAMSVEPGLDARAAVIVAGRMQRVWEEMSETDRATAMEELRRVIQESAGRRRVLEQLADALGFADLGPGLDLRLGQAALEAGQHESGVFYLARAARRAPGSDLAAEALARLALALSMPGPDLQPCHRDAEACLSQLEQSYAERRFPAGLLRLEDGTSPEGVSEVIQAIRARHTSSISDSSARLPAVLDGAETFEILSSHRDSDATRMAATSSFVDSIRGESPLLEVFPVLINNRIKGLHGAGAEGPSALWLHDLAASDSSGSARPPEMPVDVLEGPALRDAAVSGRVAVFDAGPQFVGIGLTSGRAMWRPIELDRARAVLPHPSVIAVDGVVILATGPDTLLALPAREDAAPIWKRRFNPWRLQALAAAGSDLLVLDRNAMNCFVLDPWTGAIRRRIELLPADARPDPGTIDYETRDPNVHAAIVGGIVCGSMGRRIVGREVRTGRVAWELELRGRLKELRRLSDRYLGVTYRGERFAVVDAETGRLAADLQPTGMTLPPSVATVEEIGGRSRLTMFATTDDSPAEFVLASFPLDGGDGGWVKGPWQAALVNQRMITTSREFVPVIIYHLSREREVTGFAAPRRSIEMSRVLFLNKATGERFGSDIQFDAESLVVGNRLGSGYETVRDLAVLEHHVIAVTENGYCVAKKGDASGSDLLKEREKSKR